MLRMLRIFLVGFMGCGKTVAGEALAVALGVPFVDLDEEISKSMGMSVTQIFARRGETAFRREEARLLLSCLEQRQVVVSTGGGTFCVVANRRAIHQAGGVSVFLDVPWEAVLRRLPGTNPARPKFGDPETAHELYRQRLPLYGKARVHLPLTGEEPPEEVARTILSALPGGA